MRSCIVAIVIALALGTSASALAAPDARPVAPDVPPLGQRADSGSCTYACQSRYNACLARCRRPSCQSSCSSRYTSCLTRCTTRN